MNSALQIKRTLSAALKERMREEKLSISAFAARAQTGRSAVKRLLDTGNTAVTLRTMATAAEAVGLELTLTAKPMSPAQIGELAQAMADAPTQSEANALKEKLIAGFYGTALPNHA
jgi:hypothetical protein